MTRAALVALAALLATAGPARAGGRPCAAMGRWVGEAGVDLGAGVSPDPVGVRLADQGYDVGHVLEGARAGVAARVWRCLELGVVARRWRMVEGTAPDGARLISTGDVAAGIVGFRAASTRLLEVAIEVELGAIHVTQALRGATVDGWFPSFTGHYQFVIGGGATAVAIALDMNAYFGTRLGDAALLPRFDAVALHLGLVHHF